MLIIELDNGTEYLVDLEIPEGTHIIGWRVEGDEEQTETRVGMH